jgi:cell division protein FtsQ
LKKINYRKIATVFAWCCTASAIGACLAFVSVRETKVQVDKVIIQISNNEENMFVEPSDVKKYFKEKEMVLSGKTYSELDLHRVEKILEDHPAVENAEVSADLKGDLSIVVKQRTPMLRIINKDGESYYIDTQSKLMPLNENYTARVLVASGEIMEPYARRYQFSVDQLGKSRSLKDLTILDELVTLSRYIVADSCLAELVHQIYVNEENDIELFPAVGGHRIIFGDVRDMEEKFRKLKKFYPEGLSKTDSWRTFSSINLKYKNLVVCTKKQMYGK